MSDVTSGMLAGLAGAIAWYLWWLHRKAARQDVQIVPALGLWADATREDGGDNTPQFQLWWIVRALICCLLLAAIAGLAWPGHRQSENVWIDVTPSLAAVDGSATRLQLAASEIAERLRNAGADRVRLIAVQDPAVSTGGLDVAPNAISNGISDLMERAEHGSGKRIPDGARWLFTDGSSPYAEAIVSSTRAEVISAGKETENVGLTGISARPSLRPRNRMITLVEAVNAGLEPASRTVTLKSNGEAIGSADIDVAPGERAWAEFDLPMMQAGVISAELTPSDALYTDDRLSLSLAGSFSPIQVGLSPDCGDGVKQAVSVMEDVAVADGPESIRIACGTRPDSTAALRLWTGGTARVDPPVHWSEFAGTHLNQVSLAGLDLLAAEPDLAEKAEPILRAGPRILAAAGPVGVDVYVDLSRRGVQADERFPIVLYGLIVLAAGRETEGMPRITRDRSEISIVPMALPSSAGSQPPQPRHDIALTKWLILSAACLLVLDMGRGLRHVS